MSVSNNLRNNRQNFQQNIQNPNQRKRGADDKAVEYKCGEETVKISRNIVRRYLVNGSGANFITDEEIDVFINLCRFQHLNPWLREAYLIKYSNKKAATMVVGKDAFIKRAKKVEDFEGFEAGIIVKTKDDRIEHRDGAFSMPGEVILGGWAKVYIRGYKVPVYNVVSFSEYVGMDGNGNTNKQWSSKPATMIRKVALVQSLREAFPEDLAGLYDQSEMGIETIDEPPIDISAEQQKQEIEEPRTEEKLLDDEKTKLPVEDHMEEIQFEELNNMPDDYMDDIEDLQGIF